MYKSLKNSYKLYLLSKIRNNHLCIFLNIRIFYISSILKGWNEVSFSIRLPCLPWQIAIFLKKTRFAMKSFPYTARVHSKLSTSRGDIFVFFFSTQKLFKFFYVDTKPRTNARTPVQNPKHFPHLANTPLVFQYPQNTPSKTIFTPSNDNSYQDKKISSLKSLVDPSKKYPIFPFLST
jgi:hypothetical protein